MKKPEGWTDTIRLAQHCRFPERTPTFERLLRESAASGPLYQLKHGKTVDFFVPDQLVVCSGHNYGETALPEDVLSKIQVWTPKHGCHPKMI